MECLRDRIEREEREEKQFQNNIVNAGADVVGLAGSFAGAMNAYSNYKNLKNEYAELQKEFAELKEKNEKKRKKINKLNTEIIKLSRYNHGEAIYNHLDYYGKKGIFNDNGIFIEFKNVGELINYQMMDHIRQDNNLSYFYNEENIYFFSEFTPEEIMSGLPSNETFSWASKEQVKNILCDLIPYYRQRIILFCEKLQYLDEEQLGMLTTEQILAIKNANICFPQNSPIYQKIYAKTKEIPPTGKSECCLLI